MNFALLSVLLIGVFSAGFATVRGSAAVSASPAALISVFAIFAAAVLVRLNRGLPSVEWKLVDEQVLKNLLDRLEEVARDYIVVLVIVLAGICSAITLLIVGPNLEWHNIKITNVVSGFCGGMFGLSLSRMGHMVWLDLSIVKLQRRVVESSARSKSISEQTSSASSKLESMRAAIKDRDRS